MADNGTNPYGAITLLDAVTSNQTSAAFRIGWGAKAVEAKVAGAGAVTATVDVYGSISEPTDETDMVLLGTITLSGTTKDVDGFALDAPWCWMLAVLTNLSAGEACTVKVAG